MKKVMSFVLVFALGLLCFANASAASAYSTTWRCTRPVEVTDLSSGIVSTEYIHAASVTFNYTITSGPNGFSGGIYKGMRVAPGKAASGTPSATSPSPVFAPSNDGTSITATFSGFNVTVNYHLRASKQNSSQKPNDYSYGDAYSSYTFTNQTVSRTHSR